MSQLDWVVSDDCLTYTALTMQRVYQINMVSTDSTACDLRWRKRARTVGQELEWNAVLNPEGEGRYKNPATAMAFAQREEDEST